MTHGKKRRIPRRRNAGKYGKSDETGTEDALKAAKEALEGQLA